MKNIFLITIILIAETLYAGDFSVDTEIGQLNWSAGDTLESYRNTGVSYSALPYSISARIFQKIFNGVGLAGPKDSYIAGIHFSKEFSLEHFVGTPFVGAGYSVATGSDSAISIDLGLQVSYDLKLLGLLDPEAGIDLTNYSDSATTEVFAGIKAQILSGLSLAAYYRSVSMGDGSTTNTMTGFGGKVAFSF